MTPPLVSLAQLHDLRAELIEAREATSSYLPHRPCAGPAGHGGGAVSQLNYKITAKAPDSVTLSLADVGAFKMTVEGAVYLAQQLLDAANVAKPGSGGFKIGGWEQ